MERTDCNIFKVALQTFGIEEIINSICALPEIQDLLFLLYKSYGSSDILTRVDLSPGEVLKLASYHVAKRAFYDERFDYLAKLRKSPNGGYKEKMRELAGDIFFGLNLDAELISLSGYSVEEYISAYK